MKLEVTVYFKVVSKYGGTEKNLTQ